MSSLQIKLAARRREGEPGREEEEEEEEEEEASIKGERGREEGLE